MPPAIGPVLRHFSNITKSTPIRFYICGALASRDVAHGLDHVLRQPAGLVQTGLGGRWKLIGYNFVIFAAGLASIPSEFYDAAKVDGASGFQQFWRISWPLLSPTTFFVLVTTVIYADQQTLIPIQILTQGGPNKASTNLVYLIFQYGFQFFETGTASALATMVFLLFMAATLVQQRLLERFVHYGV